MTSPQRNSRSDAEIASQLDRLDPASERHKILSAARRFKASWVELGEQLTQTREQGSYKKWGYTTFEAYCRRELHIRQDTANKLTRSFSFLRDHQPAVLEKREGAAMPGLDVVDLLSRAQNQSAMSQESMGNISAQALAPEARVSRQQLMKQLREADPEVFKPAAKATQPPGENDLRKALLLAERLQSLLEAQGDAVSSAALAGSRQVAHELRERFAMQRRQGAA